MIRQSTSLLVAVAFGLSLLGPPSPASASFISTLPAPGSMVSLSHPFVPAVIKGMTVHKDNPFVFDFIVDIGDDRLQGDALKTEGAKLIKYFLASLAIPEKDLWVNLSPYEKQRTIPEALGQTEMGRDMLAQDYVLKQITASLIDPAKNIGKAFWERVYAQVPGGATVQVPVNVFNKVWIVPDHASVYEHNQSVFVVDSHLKVMLEEDYLAAEKNATPMHPTSAGTADIVRTVVLPELEREINTGKNFAQLRQIVNSLILANWYKDNLKQALLNQVYANRSTVKGIDLEDGTVKQQIYERYLMAYKKGVFNFIKEDATEQGPVAKRYFSGGITFSSAQLSRPKKLSLAQARGRIGEDRPAVVMSTLFDNTPHRNAAMTAYATHKGLPSHFSMTALNDSNVSVQLQKKGFTSTYVWSENNGQAITVGSALVLASPFFIISTAHRDGNKMEVYTPLDDKTVIQIPDEYVRQAGAQFAVFEDKKKVNMSDSYYGRFGFGEPSAFQLQPELTKGTNLFFADRFSVLRLEFDGMGLKSTTNQLVAGQIETALHKLQSSLKLMEKTPADQPMAKAFIQLLRRAGMPQNIALHVKAEDGQVFLSNVKLKDDLVVFLKGLLPKFGVDQGASLKMALEEFHTIPWGTWGNKYTVRLGLPRRAESPDMKVGDFQKILKSDTDAEEMVDRLEKNGYLIANTADPKEKTYRLNRFLTDRELELHEPAFTDSLKLKERKDNVSKGYQNRKKGLLKQIESLLRDHWGDLEFQGLPYHSGLDRIMSVYRVGHLYVAFGSKSQARFMYFDTKHRLLHFISPLELVLDLKSAVNASGGRVRINYDVMDFARAFGAGPLLNGVQYDKFDLQAGLLYLKRTTAGPSLPPLMTQLLADYYGKKEWPYDKAMRSIEDILGSSSFKREETGQKRLFLRSTNGGLLPDLYDLIQSVDRKVAIVSAGTNGQLRKVQEVADAIEDQKPLGITVIKSSLGMPGVHEKVRNAKLVIVLGKGSAVDALKLYSDERIWLYVGENDSKTLADLKDHRIWRDGIPHWQIGDALKKGGNLTANRSAPHNDWKLPVDVDLTGSTQRQARFEKVFIELFKKAKQIGRIAVIANSPLVNVDQKGNPEFLRGEQIVSRALQNSPSVTVLEGHPFALQRALYDERKRIVYGVPEWSFPEDKQQSSGFLPLRDPKAPPSSAAGLAPAQFDPLLEKGLDLVVPSQFKQKSERYDVGAFKSAVRDFNTTVETQDNFIRATGLVAKDGWGKIIDVSLDQPFIASGHVTFTGINQDTQTRWEKALAHASLVIVLGSSAGLDSIKRPAEQNWLFVDDAQMFKVLSNPHVWDQEYPKINLRNGLWVSSQIATGVFKEISKVLSNDLPSIKDGPRALTALIHFLKKSPLDNDVTFSRKAVPEAATVFTYLVERGIIQEAPEDKIVVPVAVLQVLNAMLIPVEANKKQDMNVVDPLHGGRGAFYWNSELVSSAMTAEARQRQMEEAGYFSALSLAPEDRDRTWDIFLAKVKIWQSRATQVMGLIDDISADVPPAFAGVLQNIRERASTTQVNYAVEEKADVLLKDQYRPNEKTFRDKISRTYSYVDFLALMFTLDRGYLRDIHGDFLKSIEKRDPLIPYRPAEKTMEEIVVKANHGGQLPTREILSDYLDILRKQMKAMDPQRLREIQNKIMRFRSSLPARTPGILFSQIKGTRQWHPADGQPSWQKIWRSISARDQKVIQNIRTMSDHDIFVALESLKGKDIASHTAAELLATLVPEEDFTPLLRQELNLETATSQAMVQGGIDLQTQGQAIRVRKEGSGVQMTIDPAMVARMRKDGVQQLSPVILRVVPIRNLRPLLGFYQPAPGRRSAERTG